MLTALGHSLANRRLRWSNFGQGVRKKDAKERNMQPREDRHGAKTAKMDAKEGQDGQKDGHIELQSRSHFGSR